MGDDLNFAQKFTRTAADGLALIAAMKDPRAAGDAAVVIDMMTTLQRGAKRLRARNIYTSAQNVLSALHHEDDATLNGRIKNLGSLVTEYARGLGELVDTAEAPPVLTRADKWEAARETLNTLLPNAEPTDADVLSRLMRAPVTLETVQPHAAALGEAPGKEGEEKEGKKTKSEETESLVPAADIVPFLRQETTELPPLEAVAAAEPIPPAAVSPESPPQDVSPIVTLDSMMREVIADALSVARSVERTISLSYDMGERTVTEYRANELRTRLGKALSQIIRQSLTDDRVGHIDINLAGEQLHIMAGTTALRVAINPENAPTPKSAATAEPEPGLRAQLHALMDPSSLQGSAS